MSVTHDFEKIPAELRNARRWVVWRAEARGGKSTKVPFRANASGVCASSTDEKTWSNFDTAEAAVFDGKADGIGFVLGDGFVGVDLDGCRTASGVVSPQAREIIDTLASYTEASPSGTGAHVILRASVLSEGWRKREGVEIYDSGRFFTMTGKRLGIWTDVAERTQVLATLHSNLGTSLPAAKRAVVDPAEFLSRKFDSSKGEKDKYKARVHRTTGKAYCNCMGFKSWMRTGHPCWHVRDLAAELGVEPT
jgi:primase-polymerase (primpol)-like protein